MMLTFLTRNGFLLRNEKNYIKFVCKVRQKTFPCLLEAQTIKDNRRNNTLFTPLFNID